MALDSTIYKSLKREYEQKKQKAEDIAEAKKRKLYEENPNISNIQQEINLLAIHATKNMIVADEMTREIEEENLAIKLKKLQQKLDKELNKMGITSESYAPQYECIQCKDTGVLFENHQYKYCSCFTQKLLNAMYEQSNISKLEEENFDTFDNCYYSKVPDEKKYGIKKSPFENIEYIKSLALQFANQIKNKSQKNLLFTGNTGLGKTFLANAIAKVVIDQGQTVIYQTAPILMDKIITYKFSYDKTGVDKEQYNKIFDVDLLIIDDLGTETMSNNKFTELFNVINTRLLKNKKILISTNLSLKELYNQYDERMISRIIGNFTICKFVGEDIRLKKKRFC